MENLYIKCIITYTLWQYSITHCCTISQTQMFYNVVCYKIQDSQFGHHLWD